MPKSRRKSKGSCDDTASSGGKGSCGDTDDQDNHDDIALTLIRLLNNDQVLMKLKSALFPQILSDKIDDLSSKFELITKQLAKKENRISELEKKVSQLEVDVDNLQQYSRRPNLRIYGIRDTHDGEDTDSKVVTLINRDLKLNPPIKQTDIERSHRLGPAVNKHGKPNNRPIIVQFNSERTRDTVFKERFQLKHYNSLHRDDMVFVNEDLTPRRAALAAQTCDLKKRKVISDCWTYNGNIMIRDPANLVHAVKSASDLDKFKSD